MFENNQTQQPYRAKVFTSDLSGQEFWLIQDSGFLPVGLVLGNSVYSMGISGGLKSFARGMMKGEVTELTQLMYEAREKALERMEKEAETLGAEGIVGVEIHIEHIGDIMEVTAIGTAIKKDPNKYGKPSNARVVVSTQDK